jgi:hypothetical protein
MEEVVEEEKRQPRRSRLSQRADFIEYMQMSIGINLPEMTSVVFLTTDIS